MRALVAAVLVAGSVLAPVPASAVVDPACLKEPYVGNTPSGTAVVPLLTTDNEPVDIAIVGALLQDCPDTKVTARAPGGGLVTIALDENLPANSLPVRLGGRLVLPLDSGAGMWQLTKITSGGSSRTLHHPFDVYRGARVTLDSPFPVSAPNPVPVSGTVERYTSTGTLAPSANTPVAVRSQNPLYATMANLTTNSAGAFSGTVAMPPGQTVFRAVSILGAASPDRTANVNEPKPPPPVKLQSILYTSKAFVNQWWRVDATTTPGSQFTDLQISTPQGWRTTGSFGWSTSSGKLTRWWKPVAPGTYILRIRAGGAAAVYKTLSSITVTSKQTVPTYIDAKVRPTNGGTVYGGTPMTFDGHLKVRYSNGIVGPYAGRRIRIQARLFGTGDWVTTIASVTTNASGYFIAHWAMRYRETVDVRFLYLSPYVTIKNAAIVKANIKVSP